MDRATHVQLNDTSLPKANWTHGQHMGKANTQNEVNAVEDE